jgi:hypothetical protein
MMVIMQASLEKIEAVLEINQEKMNVTDLESNPEETEAVAVHQEVPNKEATVETIKTPEDRSMGPESAVEYSNQQKRRTKDDFVQGAPEG